MLRATISRTSSSTRTTRTKCSQPPEALRPDIYLQTLRTWPFEGSRPLDRIKIRAVQLLSIYCRVTPNLGEAQLLHLVGLAEDRSHPTTLMSRQAWPRRACGNRCCIDLRLGLDRKTPVKVRWAYRNVRRFGPPLAKDDGGLVAKGNAARPARGRGEWTTLLGRRLRSTSREGGSRIEAGLSRLATSRAERLRDRL
jgi:hypothetical protein